MCLSYNPICITEDVIEVFAVYVDAALCNGCHVHPSIMGTNTRCKIMKRDVELCIVIINLLVRINPRIVVPSPR